MKINREQFLTALDYCTPGLAAKEILDQSLCFVFTNGIIHTYDDECACRLPSPLDDTIEGAVPNQKLLNNLRKLPDETIDVTAKNGKLVIKGKGKEAQIRMEKEILLPISIIENPTEWQPLPESFGDAIGLVQQAAGFDDNKFSLTCVHVTPNYVEACDYFQVCRWNLQTGFNSSVLMRRNAVKHVASMGAQEFSETSSWVHFKNARGLILSCRRYTDVSEYPDLDRNMSLAGQPLSLPKSLGEAIDRAKDFIAPKGDEHDQVKIDLRPGILRVTGCDGQDLYTEKKRVDYTGQPISFMLPPDVLVDIIKKHGKCEVTEEHMIVQGSSYKYITGLSKSSNGKEEENETTEDE